MWVTRVGGAFVFVGLLIGAGCAQSGLSPPATSNASPAASTASRSGSQSVPIQAAIDTAGPNGTVVVPAGPAALLTSALTIAVPNFTLRCEAGATLTKAFSGNMLTITGDAATVEGCIFDGANDQGFAGNGVVVSGARGVTLRRVTANNNAAVGIYLINAADFTVEASTAAGNKSLAIFGETTAGGTLGPGIFHDNAADSSAGVGADMHAIAVHSTAPGSRVQSIKAVNNTLIRGTGFCFEAWKGLGDRPANIFVEGNACRATTNGDGAYSYSEVDHGSIANNTYDAAGFAGIGFELVASSEIAVVENQANGSNSTLYCAILDQSSGNTVARNQFQGCTYGIYVGSTPAASASKNHLDGNNIALKSGASVGIWLQANNASATVNNNSIVGNVITGDRSAGQVAIQLEKDAGTLDQTLLVANQITDAALVFNEQNDTGTLFVANQVSGASTAYGGSPGPGVLRFP